MRKQEVGAKADDSDLDLVLLLLGGILLALNGTGAALGPLTTASTSPSSSSAAAGPLTYSGGAKYTQVAVVPQDPPPAYLGGGSHEPGKDVDALLAGTERYARCSRALRQ